MSETNTPEPASNLLPKPPGLPVPKFRTLTLPTPKWLHWDGSLRWGRTLAYDTETTIVDLNREVPELVVLTAYDGRRCVDVAPEQVPAFVLAHKDCVWVGHNVSFDWWVVQRAVADSPLYTALTDWYACIDRMHDTMLLDLLYRLATEIGSTGIYNRDLGELAHTYCGEKISKDDPYRKRFGEIIGR